MAGSAVVTGAARGFGLEITRRLLDRGHHVVMCDVDEAAVVEAAAALGPRATGMACDVGDPDAHRRAAAAAAEIGALEVWVNNAGVAPAAKVWEHDDDVVTRTVGVNLLGVMHGSRGRRSRRWGRAGDRS
jgi:NAD(P)-dependent dehydrogenase (short-subunit alcohol dehydrogenase family)